MSLSDDDPLSSPTNKNQETEKKSETSTSTSQATFVLPPMNADEEVLKSRYGSFWENPNYYESENIITNTGNLLNPSGDVIGGNMSSQRDPPDPIQIKPTTGDVKNNNDESYYSSLEDCGGFSDAEPMMLQSPRTGSQMGEEGNGTNTCDTFGNQSNISLVPCGIIASMLKAKKEREEIKMVTTPRLRIFNRDQWTIKRILNWTDSNPDACRLRLPRTPFEPYFQNHLPEADFQKLAQDKDGIIVNVYDHDTMSTHELCLVLRGNHYALVGGWRKAFITRRGLREGQEIGFYWDASDSMLHFTVLDYSYGKPLAEEKIPKRKRGN